MHPTADIGMRLRQLDRSLGEALGYHSAIPGQVAVPAGAQLFNALVPRIRDQKKLWYRYLRGESMKIKKSSSTRKLPFMLVSSTDHATPMSGLAGSVTVTLSKNGGAFAAPSGAISEIGSTGHYVVAGNVTDSNTLGSLKLRATAAGCDEFVTEFDVVAYDPEDATHLGVTALKPNSQVGQVTAIISPSTAVVFATGLSNQLDHAYSGRDVYWTSGVLAGHTARAIRVVWNGGVTAHEFDFSPPLPDTPSATDEFVVLPQRVFGPEVLLVTTIASVTTQLLMATTDFSPNNDAFNNCIAIFYNQTTLHQLGVGVVSDSDSAGMLKLAYTTGTNLLGIAAGDIVIILADRSIKPTTNSELLDAEKLNAYLGSAVHSVVTGSPTASVFRGSNSTIKGTSLVATDDYYNGAWLVFGGSIAAGLRGVTRRISDYTGSTREFSFLGATSDKADYQFPAAPGGGAEFMIIGHAGVVP